ncbi:hypothetical protein PR202_ga21409 [Eleusine coracana subsp. coracana]|uniref:DEK C-terminal domain-containing protein n=1 Tax=Eleusine coracana subsp. coracana TaxID=191504 RepID=A0AAV5CZ30_ELECO|nr:hypothetical protein PR202_ga21409 [Eleusine coracana subsp. coracana]
MVSDQELAHYVESLVRQTASRGGSAISADAVMRQLEAQLRVDLTPKTQLIRDILVALLGPAHGPEHPSRKDPFEAAAGASAGPAAPSQPHFAAAAASASAPPPAYAPLLPAADAVLFLCRAAVPAPAPAAPPCRARLPI